MEWHGNSTIFRGYFPGKLDNDGKVVPAEKVKGKPGQSWDEVCKEDSFGAILNEGFVDISFDSDELSQAFWDMADKNNWNCLTCPHFRHTYFSGINTAAEIIESEGFINLSKSERDFLLNALDWDVHKEYAFPSCGCSLTTMCDWWNQPYFRGNAFQTFRRVASIQTDIFKKKVEIENGKNTN